jgi:hypothetical protein
MVARAVAGAGERIRAVEISNIVCFYRFFSFFFLFLLRLFMIFGRGRWCVKFMVIYDHDGCAMDARWMRHEAGGV